MQARTNTSNAAREAGQPNWELVANLGDVNPIDYGGYFVYRDTTGVYPPEAELLIAPDEEPENPSKAAWITYRFILEPCTLVDGILSDNKFHPQHAAWFARDLKAVAGCCGYALDELVLMFLSADPCDRAHAWRAVGDYHGFDNLDSYPNRLTRAECETRYAEETKGDAK